MQFEGLFSNAILYGYPYLKVYRQFRCKRLSQTLSQGLLLSLFRDSPKGLLDS